MVGDEHGDVGLRIEHCRDIIHESKVAVAQSKRLVLDAKQWLDEYRAGDDQQASN